MTTTMRALRRIVSTLLLLSCPAALRAEVLIRWDQDQTPSPASLGVTTLVVPGTNITALRHALSQGYRVFLEVDAASITVATPLPPGLAGVVVKGVPSSPQMRRIRQDLQSPGARVLVLEQPGKWPHIRSNWVTKNNEVLQVSSRSAQPWIENNAALVSILGAWNRDWTPLLSFSWSPTTVSEANEGPALHNYLVAIAEAGSYGVDLVLPLHERFERRLLRGQPQARADWAEIRRYIEFYSWASPDRYRPLANIAVVTAEPLKWFEVMNLLRRHNLPFEIVRPAALPSRDLSSFALVIAAGETKTGNPAQPADPLVDFARKGGRVMDASQALADPNAFALQVRQALGPQNRVIDIWNGITVLVAPYQELEDRSVLVLALNYAEQPVPVQIRVRGLFSLVQFESPGEPPSLLPYQHRDGGTEFVLPVLRVGGRVFLSADGK
jgi:hypothetical protein